MDDKLILTEREMPDSYAGRDGLTSLLRVNIQEHSFALNIQGYFDRYT